MTGKPPDGSAQEAESFAQVHARLIADPTIQFEFPPVEPRPRQGSVTLFEFLNSPITTFLFWLLVAALAIAILYFLARRFADRPPSWRRGTGESVRHDLRPERNMARQLLEEADLLARQGRFPEATRLILFRSVEDIDSRRPGLLRPAFTSRDIAALPELPDRPRAAFAGIAAIVERSLFAMRPLGREDWDECRSAYERFAFAGGWQ